MKAILEFNMDDDYEVKKHFQCLKGSEALRVLDDILQSIRNDLKYDMSLSEDYKEALKDIREELRVVMGERGIDLEELL